MPLSLSERITAQGRWPALEQAAIQMVTAGGLAAMGYYRDAVQAQAALAGSAAANPSTLADLAATAAILQTAHATLPALAERLGAELHALGEETPYLADLRGMVAEAALARVRQPEDFFAATTNTLRLIFDGIDGTGNFTRGIPLFCSAVALLVEGQARVAAVYDPIHHHVQSAVLAGPQGQLDAEAHAAGWQVASGLRVDLAAALRAQPPRPLKQEAIGVHFTRSHPGHLQAFLRPSGGGPSGMLERLALASGGVYALNSGVVAMTEVARGTLGGFVNSITNPWDVAAGEVLVRACGGHVTTFAGAPIRYDSPAHLSVVAAKPHLHAAILDLLR